MIGMVAVVVVGLAILVGLAVSALGALLVLVPLGALLTAALVFAAVRLTRSFAETRRWGHQVVKGSGGRLCDSRRIEFVAAAEAAVNEDEELARGLSVEDAKLVAARRDGRIENEVAR